MLKLNTEEITIKITDSLFRVPLELWERKSKKRIGTIILMPPINEESQLHLNIDDIKKKEEYEEEILIGLSQYIFATQGVKELKLHGVDGQPSKYKKNVLVPENLKQISLKTPVVKCAIVILLSDKGEILLGKRPEGKFMPGVWEAPGGKIEKGEEVLEAASREVNEELGIQILDTKELKSFEFQFKGFKLKGHFCIATKWLGKPQALIHSEIRWVPLDEFSSYSMPLTNLIHIHDMMSLIK